MRTNLLLASVAALSFVCGVARAQESEPAPFGLRASNIVVVDHLAGFVHEARVFSDLGADASTANVYGLMGVPPIVRVGYHRVVAGRVTVGVGVHYADQTSALAQGGGQVKTWGFSPRVGFVQPLHRFFSLWLRGGFTYLSFSTPGSTSFDATGNPTSTDDESEWHLAVGAEAQLVFTPAENVGFTVGPTIEWGIAGSQTVGALTQQVRWRLYGITVGLLADF